ncbi:MAG: hypothetical protein JJV95_01125 [Sulfurospirillum sp.]|nr:hypothetical protein [Sulfurospirillum sp.]
MNNFNKAFKITIEHEGGYANDKIDRGGETRYGISKKSYPHIDIKNLSLEKARNIYYKNYWNTKRANLELLPELIAIEVFDTAVNMGSTRAYRMLQKALNLLNREETHFDDLVVDGFIGKLTIRAIDKVSGGELLKVLNGLQFSRYLKIVKNNPSQKKFFAGWIKRT